MSGIAERKLNDLIQLASEQSDAGYLSDVHIQGSNAPSELSQDFIVSTHVLEQHFKDKYKVLRDAYERRLRDLAHVINQTCENLLTDAVIQEMKYDAASSAFIPAHIAEVFDRHMSSERERYIHDVLTKLGTLKFELARSKEIIKLQAVKITELESDVLRGKKAESGIDILQKHLEELKRKSEDIASRSEQDMLILHRKNEELEARDFESRSQLKQLSAELAAKNREYDMLKNATDGKHQELERLSRSYEDSSRVVAELERSELQREMQTEELKEQNRRLAEQIQSLKEYNNDLKVQIKFASDELDRTKQTLQEKTNEDSGSRQQVAALMAQVESMLEAEASESNAAILAVQEKMRQMKHKLTIELQAERRTTASLKDELQQLRSDREDKVREIKAAFQEACDLREQLGREQLRNQALQLTNQQMTDSCTQAKTRATDAEARLKIAEERLQDLEHLVPAQVKLAEDLARRKAEEDFDSERSRIDLRTSAYRLHYQNQLGELQNQLRHSYTFGVPNAANVSSSGVVAAEVSAIKSAQEQWRVDRSRIEAQHAVDLKTAEANWQIERSKLSIQHEAALNKLRAELESKRNEHVAALQQRLDEASDNIDKLKDMLVKSRENSQTVFVQLRKRVEELEATYSAQSQDLLLLEKQKTQVSASLDESTREGRRLQGVLDSRTEEIFQLKTVIHRLEEDIQSARLAVERSTNVQHDLEIKNAQLQQTLQTCQEQAMLDQSRDAATLSEMTKKFDALVHRYEMQLQAHTTDMTSILSTTNSVQRDVSVTRPAYHEEGYDYTNGQKHRQSPEAHVRSVADPSSQRTHRDRKDSSHLSPSLRNASHHSHENFPPVDENDHSSDSTAPSNNRHEGHKDRAYAQLSTIRALEKNMKIKVDMADAALKEASFEKERSLKSRQRVSKLYELLAKIEDQYKERLRELRTDLDTVRDVVQGIGSVVAVEVRRITRSIGVKAQAMFERMELKKSQEVDAARVALAKAHMVELELLERSYKDKIEELLVRHAEELERVREDLITRATSFNQKATNASSSKSTVISLETSRSDAAAAFFHALSADETQVSHHQQAQVLATALRGILEALVATSAPSEHLVSQIIEIALSRELSSQQITSSVKDILYKSSLAIPKQSMSSSYEADEDHLEKNISFPVMPSRNGYFGASSRSIGGTSGGGTGKGYEGSVSSIAHGTERDILDTASVISDMREGSLMSSRAFDVAVGELEQTRHEQAMLLDLARIEYEAKVKALTSRIEDLQRHHRLELESIQAEASESEALLRAVLQEEIVTRCASADKRAAEAEEKLAAEQERRQQLQGRIAEIETLRQREVQALEQRVVELQQRAEMAELEAAKLRIEAIKFGVQVES